MEKGIVRHSVFICSTFDIHPETALLRKKIKKIKIYLSTNGIQMLYVGKNSIINGIERFRRALKSMRDAFL